MQIILEIITNSLNNHLLFSGRNKKIVVLTANYGRKIWNTKQTLATYTVKFQRPKPRYCRKSKFVHMVHYALIDANINIKSKAKLM